MSQKNKVMRKIRIFILIFGCFLSINLLYGQIGLTNRTLILLVDNTDDDNSPEKKIFQKKKTEVYQFCQEDENFLVYIPHRNDEGYEVDEDGFHEAGAKKQKEK